MSNCSLAPNGPFFCPTAHHDGIFWYSGLDPQNCLKQDDLDDVAPQSRISEILSGARPVSKEIAKRFHVHADLFL
jgi:antitoxin component HigA of HigAB toxin-antitoxin module